jgi:hypothetical protein
MRTKLLVEHYRRCARRTRMSMAILAVSLFAAIGMLFIVGARASDAAFLDSEARNFASLTAADDVILVAVVALVFAMALASVLLPRRN